MGDSTTFDFQKVLDLRGSQLSRRQYYHRQFAATPFGGSDGIPTRISMLTGFPAFTAGLKVHWLNANFAAASISLDNPRKTFRSDTFPSSPIRPFRIRDLWSFSN